MTRPEYEKMNIAQRKLALKKVGFLDTDPVDILNKMSIDGVEFGLQFIGQKWGIVVFGRDIRHKPLFETMEDAVWFTALDLNGGVKL
jgi:hypothetical protein